MKITISKCQNIVNLLEALENESYDEKGKINPRLSYAINKINIIILKKLFSKEVGFKDTFKKYLEYQNKTNELKKKCFKNKLNESGVETTDKIFDNELFNKELKTLEEENKELLEKYLEFQTKEIIIDGDSLYKIKLFYLPEKLSKYIIDRLNEFDLLME